MIQCLFVGIGGMIGAVSRYLFNLIPISFTNEFPITTLLINFIGSFLIAIISETTNFFNILSPNAVLFLKTGFCGGFTTFSTFTLETFELFEKGKFIIGIGYVIISVSACLAGICLGKLITKIIVGKF